MVSLAAARSHLWLQRLHVSPFCDLGLHVKCTMAPVLGLSLYILVMLPPLLSPAGGDDGLFAIALLQFAAPSLV